MDIFASIDHGFPEKGMPAWGKALSSADVRKLTAFVGTLRNTNAPGGKAPQGEPVL